MDPRVSYRQFSDSAAQNYQRYFVPMIGAPVARDLLEAARLTPAERVLDVACGTGVVTRSAAEGVGREGWVVGTDVAQDMIDVARSTPAPAGAELEWRQADAASLPFPDDAFDVVLCQMGLPFFEDKGAALREMRRVLAPGGRVVLNTPGAMQPPFEVMEQAVARHIGPQVGRFVRIVFSMDDPDEVGRLVREAGFRDVDAWRTSATLHLPGAADFLWQYVNLTPMGNFVNPAPEEAKAALEQAMVQGWEGFVRDDGTVRLEQPMVVGTGRA